MNATDQPRILIVDDNEQNRYVHSRYLKQAGYLVQEATNGSDGLRLVRETRPDLVLLDVRLPDINGYQICRQLKEAPDTASLPVLQTSATFTSSEARTHGLQGGADAYIVIPAEPEELVATVRALLRTREAEARAQAMARTWQVTFDAISDGICVLEHENRVVRSNRAFVQMVGLKAPTVLDVSLSDLLRVDDPAKLERLCRDPDGEAHELSAGPSWFRLRIDTLPEGEQSAGAKVAVISDITGFKAIEQSLRRTEAELAKHASELEVRVAERTHDLSAANANLEAFSYTVSHDLRTPLRSLQSFAELLIEECAPTLSETHQDYLRRIARAARRMDVLTHDLLLFTRINRIEMALARVEPLEVFNEVVHEYNEHGKWGSGTFDVVGPMPPIVANGPVLHQVIANLIGNALKFVQPGQPPRVRCRAEERGATVRLWVEDEGIGISADQFRNIFSPFVRLHGDAQYPGTGMGLAIVQKGVERMQGQIGVESTPGSGSRFWVEFPLARKPSS